MGARVRVMVALAATAVLLAGCSGDGSDSKAPPKTTSTAPPATTKSGDPLAEPAVVKVTLGDSSLGLPAEITAGPTRFVATNSGKVEHQLVLVKLEATQGVDDVAAVFAGDAAADVATGLEGSQLVPGPQAVGPGDSQSVVVDLEPGDYAAVSPVRDSDGIPRAAKGMLAAVKVAAPSGESPGTAIPAEPTITMDDYSFALPEDFDGQGRYRVENDGDKPHELALYRVAKGRTFVEAQAYLSATIRPDDPSPVTPAGGVAAMSPGTEAAVDLDLEPGTYVAVCFLPGTDGTAHFLKGMLRQVNVA